MIARPLKIAFFLIGLFSRTVASPDQSHIIDNSLMPLLPETCRPLSPLNIFYQAIPRPENITPLIDTSLMANRITGKKEYQLTILDAITQLKEINPETRSYIDFVFTHAPTFKITAYAQKEYKKISSMQTGLYDGINKEIILSSKLITGDINQLMLILSIHFWHAAINTMHSILSKDHSKPDIMPYFPNNNDERQKAFNLFTKEDSNIHKLNEYLEKEERHMLDKHTQKQLTALRQLADSSYQQFYKKSRTISSAISKQTAAHLESKLNTKLHPGVIIPGASISEISFDDALNLGSVKIMSIQKDPQRKNVLYLQLELLDPLRFAIKSIIDERKSNQSPHLDIATFYATLQASVHPAIIKFLYPQSSQNIEHLIKAAQQVAVPYKPFNAQYVTASERIKKVKLQKLLNPYLDDPDYAKKAIKHALDKMENKPKESIAILKKLIADNQERGLANLALATAYSLSKDYVKANEHFKQAKDLKTEFSEETKTLYQISLQAAQKQQLFSTKSTKDIEKKNKLEKTLFTINNPIR